MAHGEDAFERDVHLGLGQEPGEGSEGGSGRSGKGSEEAVEGHEKAVKEAVEGQGKAVKRQWKVMKRQ